MALELGPGLPRDDQHLAGPRLDRRAQVRPDQPRRDRQPRSAHRIRQELRLDQLDPEPVRPQQRRQRHVREHRAVRVVVEVAGGTRTRKFGCTTMNRPPCAAARATSPTIADAVSGSKCSSTFDASTTSNGPTPSAPQPCRRRPSRSVSTPGAGVARQIRPDVDRDPAGRRTALIQSAIAGADLEHVRGLAAPMAAGSSAITCQTTRARRILRQVDGVVAAGARASCVSARRRQVLRHLDARRTRRLPGRRAP